jgi:XTP/dITP diphosphohydrolase
VTGGERWRAAVFPGGKLLLATYNRGKQAEIAALLAELPLTLIGPDALRDRGGANLEPPVESASTYAQNALLKAHAAHRATGLATLADDSGLEVDALDGAPGVISARFSGPDATDAENNALLLARLGRRPLAERTARFVCVAALVAPHGVSVVTTGEVRGFILDEPRGRGGFGYDPLFYYAPFDSTFGEAPAAKKNAVSHRAAAFRAMAVEIQRLLAGEPAAPSGRRP